MIHCSYGRCAMQGNRVGFRHPASMWRTSKVTTGAQPPWGGLAKASEARRRDIGTQTLRKGLAKAAEVRRADIGAQPLRRRLAGNPFSTECARAHPVGVAPELVADWGVGRRLSTLVLFFRATDSYVSSGQGVRPCPFRPQPVQLAGLPSQGKVA